MYNWCNEIDVGMQCQGSNDMISCQQVNYRRVSKPASAIRSSKKRTDSSTLICIAGAVFDDVEYGDHFPGRCWLSQTHL